MATDVELDLDFDAVIFKPRISNNKKDFHYYEAQLAGYKIEYEKQFYCNQTEITIYKQGLIVKFIRFCDSVNPKGGTDHQEFFPYSLKLLGYKKLSKNNKNQWIDELAGGIVRCNGRLWVWDERKSKV